MRPVQKRNRTRTERRIISALQTVIAEQGLAGLTINEVALRAQVSKVLIYRYFGSAERLLDAYIDQGPTYLSYCPNEPDQRFFSSGEEASLWLSRTLQLFRGLRCSKGDRELLKAGLTGNDAQTTLLRQAQDAQLNDFVQQLLQRMAFPGHDPQATMTILLGGLSYLTLLAHADRPMLGINLRSEVGWQRVEMALKNIFQAIQKSRLSSGDHRNSPVLD